MQGVVEKYLAHATVPVLIKPNAGLPRCEGDRTYYDVTPTEFAQRMQQFVKNGARVVGGCCGTTPEYIAALHTATFDLPLSNAKNEKKIAISSYNHAVIFDDTPISVGKAVDPTTNSAVLNALLDDDIDSIVDEAFEDIAEGARVLQVCVCADGIDEASWLAKTVQELQSVINVPLWLRSNDAVALEKALRVYNGKAMISAADNTSDTLQSLLPAALKYGAAIAGEAEQLQAISAITDDVLPINADTIEFV
jgi:5-methyltetrahydrofolate--homocysteine methyltransferase